MSLSLEREERYGFIIVQSSSRIDPRKVVRMVLKLNNISCVYIEELRYRYLSMDWRSAE